MPSTQANPAAQSRPAQHSQPDTQSQPYPATPHPQHAQKPGPLPHQPPATGQHAATCAEPLLAPADWPEPWSIFWQKTIKTPTIVWTYQELSLDLTQPQAQSKERSVLWKFLLKSLGWPRGMFGFWPMSEYHEGAFTPRPDMFWEGIRRLQPQYIACFGQAAFQLIAPDADPNLHAQPYKDYLLHHLPAPQDLAQASPPKRTSMIQALHTLHLDQLVSRET